MSARCVVEVCNGADAPDGMCMQLEMVKCGSARCKECAERGASHGPYWYAYAKHEGRTVTVYVGREKDFAKAKKRLAAKRRGAKRKDRT